MKSRLGSSLRRKVLTPFGMDLSLVANTLVASRFFFL